MSFAFNMLSTNQAEENFSAVIDRLKIQGILPPDSFVGHLPFFNFSHISANSQIKEMFFNACDQDLYRSLIQYIAPSAGARVSESMSQRLSELRVMSFAHIVLYKVLPCPESDCVRCPREIATHNQYKDAEYECPFYHHEKDRRRLVITVNLDEEFVYKANYFEEGRKGGDKDRYSQNYFESMFHPLYYKMFKCKRSYCNLSAFCPFFHSNEEKRTWDELFSNFVRKDRVSYVKDKQKYFESETRGPEVRQMKPEPMDHKAAYYEKTRPKNNRDPRQHMRQSQQPNQSPADFERMMIDSEKKMAFVFPRMKFRRDDESGSMLKL